MIDHQRGVSVRSGKDVFSDRKNSESKNFYGERTVSSTGKWYHRSGYASLYDLESTDWKDIFTELENIQSDFLSRQGKFRSPEYKWPHDPLHCVARPWEYAYVLSNLTDWQESHPEIDQLKVMDFGSGVTFFPFALARQKMDVAAVDVDPIAQNDFTKAAQVIITTPGSVSFILSQDDNTIPVGDSTFDCVYSISVLEHISDRISAVKELARVLKPYGLLILTFDVGLQGNSDISPVDYLQLTNCLRDQFDLVWPEVTIHPSRALACYNGPYPMGGEPTLWRRLRNYGRNCVRSLMGKSVLTWDHLVMGMVLRKL